jgi:hypothetical protein
VLDISDEKDAHPFEMLQPSRSHIAEFLKEEDSMQHLTSLDISGESKIAVLTKLHMNVESYQLGGRFFLLILLQKKFSTCNSSLFLSLVHRTLANVGNNFNS